MKLALTPDQKRAVMAVWQPGHHLIAKIAREAFNGANADTSGELYLEAGSVPDSALPGMRNAIKKARKKGAR